MTCRTTRRLYSIHSSMYSIFAQAFDHGQRYTYVCIYPNKNRASWFISMRCCYSVRIKSKIRHLPRMETFYKTTKEPFITSGNVKLDNGSDDLNAKDALKCKQNKDKEKALSNRQRFKRTEIDPKTMELIDQYRLGIRSRADKKRMPLTDAIMFKHKAKEYTTISHAQNIPENILGLPEIAFIGRSNVGKSSLLNALYGSKLAAVSDQPGHTKALHFYIINKQCVWTDMPGYGFAYGNKESISNYPTLIKAYLNGRKHLRKLFLLIDSRHGIKYIDNDFINYLEEYLSICTDYIDDFSVYRNKIKFQIVLTKCDLVPPKDLARRYEIVKNTLDKYKHADDNIVMASLYRRSSIDALWKELLKLNVIQCIQSVSKKDINSDVKQSSKKTSMSSSAMSFKYNRPVLASKVHKFDTYLDPFFKRHKKHLIKKHIKK